MSRPRPAPAADDVAWLLGIRDPQLLALHPMRGALFETWVLNEFRKFRLNCGLPADLYFWRDNNGLEADLALRYRYRLPG